jgi:phosphoribosylformylglycinamidine synthase
VFLLGTTREELSGSEWAHVVHGHLGGLPPAVDLAAERVLGEVLVEAARQELVAAAHDLSDGGLAQALVEASLRRGVGVRVTPLGDPFVDLFAESAGRAVVAVAPEHVDRFVALCATHGCPSREVGVTTAAGSGATLEIEGLFEVPLAELREAWSATLPAALA